jgi:hypothetical protein
MALCVYIHVCVCMYVCMYVFEYVDSFGLTLL